MQRIFYSISNILILKVVIIRPFVHHGTLLLLDVMSARNKRRFLETALQYNSTPSGEGEAIEQIMEKKEVKGSRLKVKKPQLKKSQIA